MPSKKRSVLASPDGSSTTSVAIAADGTACDTSNVQCANDCVAFDTLHYFCASKCGAGGSCPNQFSCVGDDDAYCFQTSALPPHSSGGGCSVGTAGHGVPAPVGGVPPAVIKSLREEAGAVQLSLADGKLVDPPIDAKIKILEESMPDKDPLTQNLSLREVPPPEEPTGDKEMREEAKKRAEKLSVKARAMNDKRRNAG